MRAALVLFLTTLAVTASAVTGLLAPAPGAPDAQPVLAGPGLLEPSGNHLLFSSTKSGLMVRLPILNTDPNVGPTYGAAVIWIVASDSSTIKFVHAPYATYNSHFGPTLGYSFYYFPRPKTDVTGDISISQYWDRDAILEYDDKDFHESGVELDGRAEGTRDGSRQFYGIGPRTSQSGQSDYTFDTLNYGLGAGFPLSERAPLKIMFRHALQADEIEGSFPPIPDTVRTYPQETKGLQYRRINVSDRAYLIYDSRDSADTSSRGTYAEGFFGGSRTDLLSAYNYTTYGATLKTFLPVGGDEAEPRFITASFVRFETLNGSPPFWLLPELGGKYSLRSYGDGRFVDHSMIVAGVEERCRVYATKYSGIPFSVWADPFAGLGTVGPRPELLQDRYMHPAVGVAFRVVSRPQFVESLDFGYGQEGLKTFFDVKYAF